MREEWFQIVEEVKEMEREVCIFRLTKKQVLENKWRKCSAFSSVDVSF